MRHDSIGPRYFIDPRLGGNQRSESRAAAKYPIADRWGGASFAGERLRLGFNLL